MDKKINILTASILKQGKENAVSWQVIARILDLTSRRDVYELIQHARETFVILPDGAGGYYLADTDTPEGLSEISRFVKRGHDSAIAILTSLKTARIALKEKGVE